MNDPLLRDARALCLELDAWLVASQPHFDPFERVWQPERSFRRKVFTELALVLDVADRLTPNPALKPLGDWVLAVVADERFRERVARDAINFDQYCPLVSFAARRGILPENLRRLIRDILADSHIYARGLPPHRLLALWNFCHATGLGETRLDVQALASLSAALNPPSVAEATIDDAYTLTHDLFFLSNFGFSTPPVKLHAQLETVLSLLILRCLAEKHLDGALEIAASAAMIHRLPQRILEMVVRAACNTFRTLGRLPSPPSGIVDMLREHDPRFAEWAGSYHTMLVGDYTLRVLLSGRAADDAFIVPRDVDEGELMMLGYALSALSRSRLRDGATWLFGLRDSTLREVWPDAFSEPLAFIARQRSTDGTYGLFVEDLLEHESKGGNRADFYTSVVAPTSEACSRVVEEFTRVSRTTSTAGASQN